MTDFNDPLDSDVPHRGGEPGIVAEPVEPRRDFLKKSLAVLVGGAIVTVPVGVGVMVALDPLRRGGAAAGFINITTLDALPADGSPQQFQVMADRHDAWNVYRRVPLGAVYLRRTGPQQVLALNVVCPHAGCFVEAESDGTFFCPCHNSGFGADGSRETGCVSPRAMDQLEVDPVALAQGVVSVRFQNFIPGRDDKQSLG